MRLTRAVTLRVMLLLLGCTACATEAPTPPAPSGVPTGRLLVLETSPCNWLQPPDSNRCDTVGLALIDLEGEKLEDLTPDPADAPISLNSFALSPSRDRIAWKWNWELRVMSLDGSQSRVVNQKVLAENQGEHSFDPAWSPDGTELIYRSVGPNMVSTWYRVVIETGEMTEVRLPVDCWAMAWAPGGETVACEVPQRFEEGGSETERADIYVVDLATLAASPVTAERDAIDDRRPDWSPDGEWLAIARGTHDATLADEVSGIWLVPAAGGEGTRVAAGSLSVPTWSPDGNHLAAFDNESMQIVIFGRDGSGFTTLDHEPRLFVVPRWIDD
jgi:Tol biopolymer transport system component